MGSASAAPPHVHRPHLLSPPLLLAGVDPRHTLPITLDVGTENETLRALPWYCGLRQGRPSRDAYDKFVEEFVKAVKARFGPRVLLQVRVG